VTTYTCTQVVFAATFYTAVSSVIEVLSSLALRPRGHQFQLPTCVYRLFKCSFV